MIISVSNSHEPSDKIMLRVVHMKEHPGGKETKLMTYDLRPGQTAKLRVRASEYLISLETEWEEAPPGPQDPPVVRNFPVAVS